MSRTARKAFFITLVATSMILGFACYETYWRKTPPIATAGSGK